MSESRRPHGRGIEERRSLVFNWCGLSLFCSGPPVTQAGQELLNQWYVAPFIVDGLVLPHGRTLDDGREGAVVHRPRGGGDDPDCAQSQDAQGVGRKVKNFDRTFGQPHCRDIVTRGNVEKFRQYEPLREFLIDTAGKVNVQASPSDCIWGIGLRQSDERALDPRHRQKLLAFEAMAVHAAASDLERREVLLHRFTSDRPLGCEFNARSRLDLN